MELTGVQPPPPPEDPVTVAAYPEYRLEQNFPNPFNPVTEIRYSVKEAGHVRLSVYNVIGQEVAILVDAVQDAGPHSVAFEADRYPSGVYFCRMTAGDFSGLRRMVLLR